MYFFFFRTAGAGRRSVFGERLCLVRFFHVFLLLLLLSRLVFVGVGMITYDYMQVCSGLEFELVFVYDYML
jgi:hypothetical protein